MPDQTRPRAYAKIGLARPCLGLDHAWGPICIGQYVLLGPFAGLVGANTAWASTGPYCLGPYSLCLGLARTLLRLDLPAYPYIYHM